jgi:hypothetical protein
MSKQSNERLIATALHCNPKLFLHGNVTGNLIEFGHTFVSQPTVIVSVVGTGTISSMSYNKDSDGYYVSASVGYDCTSVNFIVIGIGIAI